MKTISNIGELSRRGLMVALAAILSFVAVLAYTQSTSAASCRYYNTNTPTAHPAPSSGDPGNWYYAVTTYAPSGSACGSINIVRSTLEPLIGSGTTCANMRIRFYPTSGGSWVTNYQLVCTGVGAAKLATSVINGTKYRVEADKSVEFQVYD